MMDKNLWEKCVAFHGHECPGLAIGFKACEAAVQKIGITFAPDEEIVCVTENDACGVDAVQVITGCTMGKGNLIYRETGKMAFSFFDRKNGASIRVYLLSYPRDMSHEQQKAYLLNKPAEELFSFSKPNFEVPETARSFKTIICEKCGEGAPENKIRLQNGRHVCLDCFEEYNRGW